MTIHLNKMETYDFIINLEVFIKINDKESLAYTDIDFIISFGSNI